MVSDADHRLAELLAAVDLDETIVVVLGDNGSPPEAVMPPYDGALAKGTVYEGGVNIPLVVRGAGVARGGEARQLAHVTDVFATVAELAGVPLSAEDPASATSLSFTAALQDPEDAAATRSAVVVEGFEGRGAPERRPERTMQAVVSDDGWKLVRIDACAGALDPDDHRDWVCDRPRAFAAPTLELYALDWAPGEAPAEGPGFDLLADGIDADEQAVIDRLLPLLDDAYAPQEH